MRLHSDGLGFGFGLGVDGIYINIYIKILYFDKKKNCILKPFRFGHGDQKKMQSNLRDTALCKYYKVIRGKIMAKRVSVN